MRGRGVAARGGNFKGGGGGGAVRGYVYKTSGIQKKENKFSFITIISFPFFFLYNFNQIILVNNIHNITCYKSLNFPISVS